jgi:hypothetical protein
MILLQALPALLALRLHSCILFRSRWQAIANRWHSTAVKQGWTAGVVVKAAW